MPTLVAGVVAVVVLYLLLQMFRAANPAVLARAIKIVGGVVSLAVAAYTGVRGELAVAIPLGIFGARLLGWAPFGASGFFSIGGAFGGGAGPPRAKFPGGPRPPPNRPRPATGAVSGGNFYPGQHR